MADGKNQIGLREASSWQRRLSHWESVSIGMLNYTNVPAFRPEERAQLEAFSEETRKRLGPASAGEITRIIAKLSIACRHAVNDEIDRKALVALMVEFLLGYPQDILDCALSEWIRTQTFFPSIAEFRALCEPEYKRRQSAFIAMRQALERSETKAREAEEEARRRAEWSKPEKRAQLENLTKTAWGKLGGRPMKRAVPDAAERARIRKICDDAREKERAETARPKS